MCYMQRSQARKYHCLRGEGTFHGSIVLTHSFPSFYRGTLSTAEARWRELPVTLDVSWYMPLLLLHSANFTTSRAAENLLLRGYPFSGYRLLRDLKEWARILGAIASGLTTYQKVCGLEFLEGNTRSLTEDDMSEIQKRRQRAESAVQCNCPVSAAGLPVCGAGDQTAATNGPEGALGSGGLCGVLVGAA
jgi:hypothetical protein